MKLKQRETGRQGVMRACLDLLAAEGIWHRRWNVGAVKIGNRFFRFGQKGDADILAIPEGRAMLGNDYKDSEPLIIGGRQPRTPKVLWIETKRPGGKITPEQLAFADDVRKRGHFHLFVDDAKQLQEWLKANRAR